MERLGGFPLFSASPSFDLARVGKEKPVAGTSRRLYVSRGLEFDGSVVRHFVSKMTVSGFSTESGTKSDESPSVYLRDLS